MSVLRLERVNIDAWQHEIRLRNVRLDAGRLLGELWVTPEACSTRRVCSGRRM